MSTHTHTPPHLNGRGNNNDTDGITSLTVDFDSNINPNILKSLYKNQNEPLLNEQRSLATYALSVNTYALQFKEVLPIELQPTSIRFTGRGFQFIYRLENPFFFNKDKVNNSSDQKKFILDTIKWLRRSLEIENNNFYEDLGKGILPENTSFSLDKAFETNLYQMRRVPGSFNPKSGMYSTYIYLTSTPWNCLFSVQDLIDFCKENYKDTYSLNHSFKYRTLKSFKSYSKKDKLIFAEVRLSLLNDITDQRYINKKIIGSRHNFLTQATNCIADVEKHKTGKEPSYSEIFNKAISWAVTHFKECNLSKKKVISAIKGVMKRREKIIKRGDSTNLSNNVICNFLQLENDERDYFKGVSKKTKQKKTSLLKQISREEKIFSAYQFFEEGYSHKEISEALNISLTTSYRYITSYYKKLNKEKMFHMKQLKNEKKEELKTTQKFIYQDIYAKTTQLIILKKVEKKIYNWLNEIKAYKRYIDDKDQEKLVSSIIKIIQKVLRATEEKNIESLRKFREQSQFFFSKIISNKSFKNIINEYVCIFSIGEKEDLFIYRRELINKVNQSLETLVNHLYIKYILNDSLKRIRPFYPNLNLAKYYAAHNSYLPFKLYETKSIKRYFKREYGYGY